MDEQHNSWTFFTNHAHVLLALFRDPDLRQRDIAALVGITEGAVQRILNELESCGYLSIERVGRRNHYEVNGAAGLRHPLDAGHTIGEILGRLEHHTAWQLTSAATLGTRSL